MRKPKIKNKYNFTMKDCRNLVVKDRSKICTPLFWRNDVISAWCIGGSTAKTAADDEFCTYSEYWIGIYDEDAKSYAGKVRVSLNAYGGMCSYNIEQFFKEKDIQNEDDLRVQELFLERINFLIDEGILIRKE